MIKSWKDVVVIVVFFLIIGITIKGCSSCMSGNSYNERANTSRDAFYKQQNGEDLTREEREALDEYNKWLEKQEDK